MDIRTHVRVGSLLAVIREEMLETGRGGFRPNEIEGLVEAAVKKAQERDNRRRTPVSTNAIAGEPPRRGVSRCP